MIPPRAHQYQKTATGWACYASRFREEGARWRKHPGPSGRPILALGCAARSTGTNISTRSVNAWAAANWRTRSASKRGH